MMDKDEFKMKNVYEENIISKSILPQVLRILTEGCLRQVTTASKPLVIAIFSCFFPLMIYDLQ